MPEHVQFCRSTNGIKPSYHLRNSFQSKKTVEDPRMHSHVLVQQARSVRHSGLPQAINLGSCSTCREAGSSQPLATHHSSPRQLGDFSDGNHTTFGTFCPARNQRMFGVEKSDTWDMLGTTTRLPPTGYHPPVATPLLCLAISLPPSATWRRVMLTRRRAIP